MKIINGQKVQRILFSSFRKKFLFLNIFNSNSSSCNCFFYFLPNGETSGYSVPTESIKI